MYERLSGTVTWFDDGKGSGFIERAKGKSLFMDFGSNVGDGRRTLLDGQQVEFNEVVGEKGPQGENVMPL